MLVIFDPCKKCLVKACCSLTCIEKVHNNLLKEKLGELFGVIFPGMFILLSAVAMAFMFHPLLNW